MNEGKDINLNHVTPTVTSDGNIVMISDQDVPTIMFFQARQQHEGHMHGDVVASVRLNNLDDLKNLSKSIDETIKKHKNREP
ncbi:hypothetical protein KW794_02125 [Candidatus Saccharibacteria bacterium]|nr:hypothetical protein [Candidatus Saccharibacteria bacterium]